MKDPDWLVQPLIPRRQRAVLPKVLPPPPLLQAPSEPRRPPQRPPLPRRSGLKSPFHP